VKRNDPPRLAASTSFTEVEIRALDVHFATLLKGGDVRAHLRSEPLRSVMRKVGVMQRTVERQRAKRSLDRRVDSTPPPPPPAPPIEEHTSLSSDGE